MSFLFPPEIRSGLLLLRRRIRRIRLFRGLLRTASVALLGLLVIAGLDFVLAPLPFLVRAGLFVCWLGSIGLAAVLFLLIPLTAKLPLVRLARWLEHRHPELQERISTTLELSDHPDGISPALLRELSEEAAADMESVDPRTEIKGKRVRAAMWPALGSFAAIVVLLAVWPQEMGRLLTRAIRPFSDLGNAGAFRFAVTPGDLEVLEGDGFTLGMVYTGDLGKPLELVFEKDGERILETLQPVESDQGKHRYAYTVHSAGAGFDYSARVGGNESDRFEVKVYPLPRLLEPVVELQYPAYTGWQDRKVPLGTGVRALAGTTVTVTGRLDTPVSGGKAFFGEEVLGEVGLEGDSRGTVVTWNEVLQQGQDGAVSLTMTHRLGRELEAAKFSWVAEDDPAPVIRLLSPLEREFRARPDDQVVMNYEVIEAIGLARADVEIEVDGSALDPLPEVRPKRIDLENGDRWQGEALVLLSQIVKEHPEARTIRMRLRLSDNRPQNLAGPGVGYSEWLEFKLDGNAESLAQQKLRNEEEDLRETVEEVVAKVEKARQKMREAKDKLREEEVSKKAEQDLAEARDELNEARAELADLAERMKAGVQAHRRDEVAKANEKLAEAQKAVENAPLQDTPEARQEEVDFALRESEEAIRDLQELEQEVGKDRPKIDSLAKLQDMARKQEALAREAEKEAPDESWEERQREMREEIRNEVRQSPSAKAAAIRAQSQQALDLAREAGALQEGQDQLSEVSEEVGKTPPVMDDSEIGQALARQQEKALVEAREELAEARRDQDRERSQDLAKAIEEGSKVARMAQEMKAQSAAETARKAADRMAEGADRSPTQNSLAKKQEKLAEAFADLASGEKEKALEALAELQETPTLREVGKALGEEQKKAVSETREELESSKRNKEERASHLAAALEEAGQALAEAEKNRPEEAAEAARQAAKKLSENSEPSLTQDFLKKKQDKLADAFQALAEGEGEEALDALREAQNVPDPATVAEALAEAQKRLLEKAEEELKTARQDDAQSEKSEKMTEDLAGAVEEARTAAREAEQKKAGPAAEAAQKAAEQLAKAAPQSPSRKSLQKQQEALADAFGALDEGDLEKAFEALGDMQSERLAEALGQALSKEQEAVVEGTQEELTEAREALEERANDLPEALVRAQAALGQAKQGDAQAAAKSARAAAEELAKGAETSATQDQLRERQEGIAEALDNLAQGKAAEALAALQEMQNDRAEELASAIQEVAPVEGNPLSEAGQLANGGAQKAQAAAESQQAGQAQEASQQHQDAAGQFERAKQSLESASQQMARQAQQTAGQSENPNRAPAPGESMAEALQRSAEAARAGQSGQQQQAAEQAQAAAQALQQAAREAMSKMQQGGQSGDQMAQADQPGDPQGESPPPNEAREGVRQAQGDKGVPPELAKLGINVDDWEKIQATLKTDVGGSGGEAIPEDYRGLVKKYFEKISQKQ